jgi:hypothetical protein
MTHWKSSQIIDLLKNIVGVTLTATGDAGSERTTEQLVYAVEGGHDQLFVRGFVTEGELALADDVDVEMIEVSTEYSDGSDSPEPANIVARAFIMAALMSAGHIVVRSLDLYF